MDNGDDPAIAGLFEFAANRQDSRVEKQPREIDDDVIGRAASPSVGDDRREHYRRMAFGSPWKPSMRFTWIQPYH